MTQKTSPLGRFRCPLCLHKSKLSHEGKACKYCLGQCTSITLELANESIDRGSNWPTESKKYFRYAVFIEAILPEEAKAIRTMINQLNVAFMKNLA